MGTNRSLPDLWAFVCIRGQGFRVRGRGIAGSVRSSVGSPPFRQAQGPEHVEGLVGGPHSRWPVRKGRPYMSDWIDVGSPPFRQAQGPEHVEGLVGGPHSRWPVRKGRPYMSDWIDVGSPPFRQAQGPEHVEGLVGGPLSDRALARRPSLRQRLRRAGQAPALVPASVLLRPASIVFGIGVVDLASDFGILVLSPPAHLRFH